jgi:FkbM family methyltransferase
VLAAFAWLPWLFYRLEILAKNPKGLNAFFAGFCFAMLFLCGSFQVTLGAFYGGTAYFLFRFFQGEAKFPRLSLRTFAALALFLLWGALPLLGQFIPTFEFVSLSDRQVPNAQSDKFNSQLSLNPATLGQFLFPRITLKAGDDMAVALQSDKDQPEFPLAADWGYLGIWIPFLLWAAWRRKDKSLPLVFTAMASITLLYSFGRFTPFHSLVSRLLPGLSLIQVPYRFLYLYALCASALAALGWDSLFPANPTGKKPAFTRKSPLVFASGLYLIALVRPTQDWREILGLVLGFVGFELYCLSRFKQTGKLLALAALTLPLLLNGWADFARGPASNFDYAGKSKAILAAAESVKPNRLIFMNGEIFYPIEVGGKKYAVNYPQNAACALGIKNFGGYNPLVLEAKREIGTLPLPVAVQVGSVGGILTQINHGTVPGFKLESYPPYLLYRNQKPLSYANAPTASLQCRLEKEEIDHQTFSIELNKDHWVFFCEMMYPGWKAWVDGQPSPIESGDFNRRSLFLSAGHHVVEFKFEPAWWTPIRIGLALWCLITFVGLLLVLRQPLFSLLQKIYYAIGGRGLGRIKPLRWTYNALFGLLKPRSVMVQGHLMWLDDRDTLQLAVNEIYEPLETDLLKKNLKVGQTFVDVGANIGYYTLLAARLLGPKGKVYAFEPDPDNFRLLQKNVAANGYSNVTLVNKALSNKEGTVKLYRSQSNRGDHRIYDSHDGRPSVEIKTMTLDRFFLNRDKVIHFIKMDVQGAEAAALSSMKGLVLKNKGLKLVTEFSPGALKAFGSDARKYLAELQKLGFRLSEISEKDKTVKPVAPAQLLKRPWGGGEDYTNLFCVKDH